MPSQPNHELAEGNQAPQCQAALQDLAKKIAETVLTTPQEAHYAPAKSSMPPSLSNEEVSQFANQLGLDKTFLGHGMAGGFGQVFIARDPRLKKQLAVKVLYKRWKQNRFRRENEAVQNLSAIRPFPPNLVSIHASGETDDYFFYTMECADDYNQGKSNYVPDTLKARIDRNISMGLDLPEPQEVIQLFSKLLNALDVLHKNGWVHLDIKPDNILFVNQEPKIGDYSLLTSTPVPPASAGGTPGFLPQNPRFLEHGNLDGIDQDLFAMGKLIYCYTSCYSSSHFPEMPELDPDAPSSKRHFYKKLNNFLLTACNTCETERFHSAEEFQKGLEACLPLKRNTSKWLPAILSFVLAVILLVQAAGLYSSQTSVSDFGFASTPDASKNYLDNIDSDSKDLEEKSTFCLGLPTTPFQKAALPMPGKHQISGDYLHSRIGTMFRISPKTSITVPIPLKLSNDSECAFLMCSNIPCALSVEIQSPKRWWGGEKQLALLKAPRAEHPFLGDFRVGIQPNKVTLFRNGSVISESGAKLPKDLQLCLKITSSYQGEIALSFLKMWESESAKQP